MGKHNIGSSFDDFLQQEAMLEEVTAVALKRVIAWQKSCLPPRKPVADSCLTPLSPSGARGSGSADASQSRSAQSPPPTQKERNG